MTKAELLQELESLTVAVKGGALSDVQVERFSERIRGLRQEIDRPRPKNPSRILELQGLGKEFWQSIDVDEYLRQERDSWD